MNNSAPKQALSAPHQRPGRLQTGPIRHGHEAFWKLGRPAATAMKIPSAIVSRLADHGR
jgi:hypothetical protein